MSRSTCAVLTVLATICAAPAVLAQALSMEEYQERRMQLEWAYVNADSDEEKAAIWEEFRQLELAQEAAPVPVEQPAKPAEQPAKAGKDASSEAADHVVEALAASLAAFADSLAATFGGTGLGAGGAEKEEVDPRIAELVEWSNRERGYSSDLKSLGWDETDDMAGYDSYHAEVGAWLDEAAKAGRSWEEWELVSWASAVNQLGATRRSIAGHRAADYWEELRDAEAKRLAALRKTLAKEKQSLQKVLVAFQNAGNMQEGVSDALALKDRLETLENILGFAMEPGKIAAAGAAISELENHVDPVGDAINGHVATLAAYVRSQAAQLEGYESMEALLGAIANTVAAIEQSAGRLAFYDAKYRLGVALEGKPVYAKAW